MILVPKKSLGQNFLLDKKIIKNIVDLGEISNESIIIEIGPGTGNLTQEILKRKPNKFFAIEKDKNLSIKLKNKFQSNLDIINEDVLSIDWNRFSNVPIIVFGNLPYNISSKILINWIRLSNLDRLFKRFVLMFQKEVADRIISKVDTSKYGRLSILTDWKLKVKKIMDIDPDNFYPKPKVKSSLVYFEPKNNYFEFKDPKNLEKVTNIFFQNRRKMIKKPLNILFRNSKKIIDKLDLDEKSRPQNISPMIYFQLSKLYEEEKH